MIKPHTALKLLLTTGDVVRQLEGAYETAMQSRSLSHCATWWLPEREIEGEKNEAGSS